MGRFHRHGHDTPNADRHDGPKTRNVGDHSGYADSGVERVAILEHLLGENDKVAIANRAAFARHGVSAINLMSSPGAGKTTLLRRTIPALVDRLRIGILEGDIATTIDADELSGLGAEIALVNTSAGFGGECHLDAVMVRAGLDHLPLADLDLIVIENVGNLVCPAEFDVGQTARAMVYAVTEGEDKPLKYPVMFRAAELIVVNKIDLLPYLDFDMELFYSNLRSINPTAATIELSAATGEGIEAWLDWLAPL